MHLNDSDLVVYLKEMALYDGNGTARIQLDARGGTPKIFKSVRVDNVQFEPLLSAAADFDRLSGSGHIEIEVSGSGRSEREIVSSLNGGGRIQVLDGAIEGINLAAIVHNVATAFLDDKADETRKTDFAELSGTFRIERGILRNDDLALLAPLIRLTGAGVVDLPSRSLDYRVRPKVTATTEGQGGDAEAAGIGVAVIAEGPWHDLSYRPDLAGIADSLLDSPGEVIDTVKEVAKDPANLVDGLAESVLGCSQGGDSGRGSTSPADLIKKLPF